MRRFLTVPILCAAALLASPAAPASRATAATLVQCDVKLTLPGGRLEATIFGDGKTFSPDTSRVSLVVPVARQFLVADPPHAFDLADPAGQTAEYRVHMTWDWIGDKPPPAFSEVGAKHPWWPVGDHFVGPPLPAGPDPDKNWTYVAWGSNGVQVKASDYIYMPGRQTPHRATVGVAYQRSDNEAGAARNASERTAFIKALSAGDTFALAFLTRDNARLGVAQVDATLLKSIPDLSDRAFIEAARMQKAKLCQVSKV